MSLASLSLLSQRVSAGTWAKDLGASIFAVLVVLISLVVGGLKTTYNRDIDSLLRLVEVRDLLNGQGWFDLHQYRMGPPGGFVMHWSRLIDAPIALIIKLTTILTGDPALGELIANFLWPMLLAVAAAFLLLRLARAYAGAEAVVPTLIIGGYTIYHLGIFVPSALDHHNAQLTLSLTAAVLLSRPGWRSAAGAGLCCALMLGIGMEAAPCVAIAGACAAALLLSPQPDWREAPVGFGLGFAVSASAVLVTNVPQAAWFSVACDAFSGGQWGVATVAGIGLAIVAGVTGKQGLTGRLIGLALLAATTLAVVLIFAPQCVRDPYANLDPRLIKLWLDQVRETQSLRQVIRDPILITARYITPMIALIVVALKFRRGQLNRAGAIVAAFLVMSILVSIWEIRASMFSMAFAVVPLADWIAEQHRKVATGGSVALVKTAGAWLASINLVWGAAYLLLVAPLIEPHNNAARAASSAKPADAFACLAQPAFALLAAQPPGTVLAVDNLSTQTLAFTPHRSLNGPYHRNTIGMLDALTALTGSDAEAEAVVRRNNVTYVINCPSLGQTRFLMGHAEDGFLAHINDGRLPSWLEPIPGQDADVLKLYKVR